LVIGPRGFELGTVIGLFYYSWVEGTYLFASSAPLVEAPPTGGFILEAFALLVGRLLLRITDDAPFDATPGFVGLPLGGAFPITGFYY
jgi:hypothetical protein